MIRYAVIDTNVFVSALLSSKDDTSTVKIVRRTLKGYIISVYSAPIIEEYLSVLNRDKFGFDKNTVVYLLSSIEKFGILTEPKASGITLPDPSDVKFYDAALETMDLGAYLITGNLKHFSKESFIKSPNEFLDKILKK